MSEVPSFPWHTPGIDLFYWKCQDFLVVGDYFSKFLIVRKLPNSSTNAIVKELSLIFTVFERPHIPRSDNGPFYKSAEFQEFLHSHGVLYITSSPHHHQPNGFTEAMVKIAKKMMEISTKERKPWNSRWLEYRTTPISNTIPSPLEILMNRKPRTLLPQIPSCFQAFPQNSSRIWEQLMSRQDKQAGTAGSAITKLEPGQPIWFLESDGKSWKTAKVEETAKEPNSYWVQFPDDSILRRTRVMLKPCSTPSYFELKVEQPEECMELTPPIPPTTGTAKPSISRTDAIRTIKDVASPKKPPNTFGILPASPGIPMMVTKDATPLPCYSVHLKIGVQPQRF